MKAKKIEYQITIGYKAVICFIIKAETKQEAEKIALQKVETIGIYEGDLQYENYAVHGTLDMDSTWNMVQP